MERDEKSVLADTTQGQEDGKNQSPSEFNSRSILVLIGAASATFSTVGFLNAFGVFIAYYQEHILTNKSAFDLTWLGSFCTFILFVAAAPAGLLVDRFGPTILLIFGGVVTVFSIFMVSLCREYYQFFLAQGLLLGVGCAFLTCPVLAVISQHFAKNRGLATGFTIAGSSLGGVIWPIAVNELLNKDGVSFGWTMRIVAFIMLPLAIITCVTVLPPAGTRQKNEEAATPDAKDKPKKKKADLSIIKNRVFQTFCVGIGLFYLGMFSPFFFVTSYAVSIGFGTSFAFYLVSILNAASLFGRISAGWLADKYGHFNLCSIAAITSSVVAFTWTAATSTGGIVVWSLAYGFCSGSILSLQMSCATKLATPETFGTSIGVVMATVSLTGLFGSPISGELIKTSYLVLSMYVGAVTIAGGVFICAARFQLSRKLWDVV